MINNQIEFNKRYSKKEERKKIEIKRNRNFQGELIIEDYSGLEKLNLRDIKNIGKIVLRNLPQLQECTTWNCGTKELVIENCPQIKLLNVHRNFLTSLEFIKCLENLETLEIDGNDKLNEVLEPYDNDWRVYQKDLQKSDKNTLELLRSIRILEREKRDLSAELVLFQKRYNFLKRALVSFSKEIQEQVLEKEISELDGEIKKAEIKTDELMVIKTDELILGVESDVEKLKKIKEEKETELYKLKDKNQELEKRLASFDQTYRAKKDKIEQKEKELEELKNDCLQKINNTLSEEKRKKYAENLDLLLKSQEITIKYGESKEKTESEVAISQKRRIESKLLKLKLLTKEEVERLYSLNNEVIKLKEELTSDPKLLKKMKEIESQLELEQEQKDKLVNELDSYLKKFKGFIEKPANPAKSNEETKIERDIKYFWLSQMASKLVISGGDATIEIGSHTRIGGIVKLAGSIIEVCGWTLKNYREKNKENMAKSSENEKINNNSYQEVEEIYEGLKGLFERNTSIINEINGQAQSEVITKTVKDEITELQCPNTKSWQDITPSFTFELIQQWINHGFSPEQCRDWVNINRPSQQEQAIQESDFYAWLRDVKKVDNDWVLNHGNLDQLKTEYQSYQQRKFQTIIEIPPK